LETSIFYFNCLERTFINCVTSESKKLSAQVIQATLAKNRYEKYFSIDKYGQYKWTKNLVENPVGIDVENPFNVRRNKETKERIGFLSQSMENVKIPQTKILFEGEENSVLVPKSFLFN